MTYIYYYYRISDDNTYMGYSMSTRPGADLIFFKIFNKFHYYNKTESYVSVLSTLLANDPADCNSNIYGKTDEQLVAKMSPLRPSTCRFFQYLFDRMQNEKKSNISQNKNTIVIIIIITNKEHHTVTAFIVCTFC